MLLRILTLCLISNFIFLNTIKAEESLAQQTSKDFTIVAKNAIPAVVSIKVGTKASDDFENPFFGTEDFFEKFFFAIPKRGNRPVYGQASGFIVKPDGYILTNSHVVKEASEIVVTLNSGKEVPAKVIGIDSNTDLAIIKVDEKDLPFLKLGDSNNIEIGQWAIAIGNPFGLQASLTVGVISAKGRYNLDLANTDYIQTDAAINKGNSGGPLLNLDGQVIGVNTAIATGNGGNVGVGFAIPSNLVKHVMDELIAHGSVTRGFIGVIIQPVDKDIAEALNLKTAEGALVAEVSKSSPAEKAGLQQGDVILSYNSHPSITNVAAFRNSITLMSPGSTLNLKVLRNEKQLSIPVVIGTYPTEEKKTDEKEIPHLGFDVQNLTPEVAKSLEVPSSESGVVVSKVYPDTPASLAGLKKGAVILAVNQKKVSNVDEFNAAIKNTNSNKPFLFLIKQGESVRFLSLKIN